MKTRHYKSVRLLVVEDSATQAEYIRYTLEKYGFEVDVATNGRKALEYLSSTLPAVIISDVVMPEIGGFELCKKVKADALLKQIPFILLTTLSEPDDVIKGLDSGADNILTKPFNNEYLIERIRYVLLNAEMHKGTVSDMGVEIVFGGQKHVINSSRLQILNLLISTYENTVIRNRELEEANRRLQKANENIALLSGLIPICAKCKQIKDDEGYWNHVETYITEHTGSVFSHGYCPECLQDAYEEIKLYDEQRNSSESE